MTNLTPEFSGDEKPVHVGVYRRRIGSQMQYSYWTGGMWLLAQPTPELAARTSQTPSARHQLLPWCGLAEDPNAKVDPVMKLAGGGTPADIHAVVAALTIRVANLERQLAERKSS